MHTVAQKFKVDKIISIRYLDGNGNPISDEIPVNKTVEELDSEYRKGLDSSNASVVIYPEEENKIIAQGKGYKITQKYSEYTDDNGITMVYPSIAKSILNKDKGE